VTAGSGTPACANSLPTPARAAAEVVRVPSLIRQAWITHRWDTRPTCRP
jgi:hypothetical protein